MTAIEELLRMLDERGVEHEGSDRSVRWRDRNGVMMQAFPLADGELGMDIWSCTPEQAIAATLGPSVPPPEPPVVPYDVLIDILRDEWDIEVMWDGLRRFWYVGLTEEGVRKRDENEKLRELVRTMWLYDYAGKFSSAQEDVEHVAMVYRCMRELGVEI